MIAGREESSRGLEDEAFLAGVLHDIGELVLALCMPERFADINTLMKTRHMTRHAAEREILHATHADMGAYLLGLWGFQDSLVEGVLQHHTPGEALGRQWGLVGLIHVASAMADHPQAVDPADPVLGLDLDYLAEVGVAGRWPAWREACAGVLGGGAAP